MKTNVQRIRKKRRYSESFKKELVEEFEKGKYSVLQLARLYGVHYTSLYEWIYKFSTFNEKGYRVVEMKDSDSQKLKELQKRLEELESSLGRKQIQVEYLEKLIELAEKEYGIDIKKNSATPRSGGSGNTEK